MSAREHDPAKTVLDVEAAYASKVAREEARHRRRIDALNTSADCLGEDPDFAGCVIDQAPYPYVPETGEAA